MHLTIAIDGPAGSGKSTIARILAEHLGITYLDTGAMYRAVTLKLQQEGISVNDSEKRTTVLNALQLDQIGQQILMNGTDVSESIRMPEVTALVSEVAGNLQVRQRLVALQQEIGRSKNIVMDGRDIGTVVLSDAPVKIFLTASPEERGRRRWLELKHKGIDKDLEHIIHEIIRRDTYDSSREHSPLKPATDAVHVNTDHLSIDQVVHEIMNIIKEKTGIVPDEKEGR